MHVLKSHEINFSKVVSDPFILKLFDIVTEPNMNFHEASGIPCPLCPKKFSSGRTLSDHHKQVHDKTNHIPCPHTPVQIDIEYILHRAKECSIYIIKPVFVPQFSSYGTPKGTVVIK